MTIRPSQVPSLVLAHQDYLRSQAYISYTSRFFDPKQVKRDIIGSRKMSAEERADLGPRFCRQEADGLNISQLFHISESMTEVAKVAAQQLSCEERWTSEIFPAYNGVLVFERPLMVTDAWGYDCNIAALTWHPTDKGFEIYYYSDIDCAEDHYNQKMIKNGTMDRDCGRWQLMHLELREANQTLGHWETLDSSRYIHYREHNRDIAPPEYADDADELLRLPHPVFGNTGHLLFAIFALMDQTITVLSEETDRRLARLARHKKHRPPPMVTVVRLRRAEHHGAQDSRTGRWLTYRSVTRGHWRQQPYGPGRSQVKRIWINPYIRGDEDLPLWQPKRVSTLQR